MSNKKAIFDAFGSVKCYAMWHEMKSSNEMWLYGRCDISSVSKFIYPFPAQILELKALCFEFIL
jgi:hypothetical protein